MQAGRKQSPSLSATGVYRATVYGNDATELRDYAMDAQHDAVACLDDAVACLRARLATSGREPVIAIVTEETLDGFNQVQVAL